MVRVTVSSRCRANTISIIWVRVRFRAKFRSRVSVRASLSIRFTFFNFFIL